MARTCIHILDICITNHYHDIQLFVPCLCRSHPTTLDLSAQYKPTKPGMGLVGVVGLHPTMPQRNAHRPSSCWNPNLCWQIDHRWALTKHVLASSASELRSGTLSGQRSGNTAMCYIATYVPHILQDATTTLSSWFHDSSITKSVQSHCTNINVESKDVQKCPTINTGKGVPSVSTWPATPWFTPP